MKNPIKIFLAGICLMSMLAGCKKGASPEATLAFSNIVPAPVSAAADGGAFFLTKDASIGTEAPNGELDGTAKYLRGLLQPSTGFELADASSPSEATILLALSENKDLEKKDTSLLFHLNR